MRTTHAFRYGGERSATSNETDDKRAKIHIEGGDEDAGSALVTKTKERMSRCELGGMSDTLSGRRLREREREKR